MLITGWLRIGKKENLFAFQEITPISSEISVLDFGLLIEKISQQLVSKNNNNDDDDEDDENGHDAYDNNSDEHIKMSYIYRTGVSRFEYHCGRSQLCTQLMLLKNKS